MSTSPTDDQKYGGNEESGIRLDGYDGVRTSSPTHDGPAIAASRGTKWHPSGAEESSEKGRPWPVKPVTLESSFSASDEDTLRAIETGDPMDPAWYDMREYMINKQSRVLRQREHTLAERESLAGKRSYDMDTRGRELVAKERSLRRREAAVSSFEQVVASRRRSVEERERVHEEDWRLFRVERERHSKAVIWLETQWVLVAEQKLWLETELERMRASKATLDSTVIEQRNERWALSEREAELSEREYELDEREKKLDGRDEELELRGEAVDLREEAAGLREGPIARMHVSRA